VNRLFISFPVIDINVTKLKMLNWINRFSIFCFLDNHHYELAHHSRECLLAAGSVKSVQANAGNAFEELKNFYNQHQHDWLFGHFNYDLKNEVEEISSNHTDNIQFPELFFFIPEIIIELKNDCINIGSLKNDHNLIFNEIIDTDISSSKKSQTKLQIQSKFSEKEYITTVDRLRQHILRGDCYEINFCQEFFAENVLINPVETYLQLSKTSPTPFAAFYRINEKYLMCASPERYLCRQGNKLTSQPIKGTSPRNINDKNEDEKNIQSLYNSKKDRSENVMVVDLVRNDLSKICKKGSVTVDELYGIYSFPQVHQMISSISGEQLPDKHWTNIIKATFPMGSMTGAPKKRVMELIEQYEKTKRGLFSGSVGYISPSGDFDFNVVIRSILYNAINKYLSYEVGSAITFYSDAKNEYEECLLKASAIKKVLAG
jgi:para-aminobenzoate synthetase component I